jgi:hypothetical protein
MKNIKLPNGALRSQLLFEGMCNPNIRDETIRQHQMTGYIDTNVLYTDLQN